MNIAVSTLFCAAGRGDVRMFATGAGCWQAGRVLIEHRGTVPQVHPSAYVAPTAVLCGAVRIEPNARVLFGAVLTAEDGRISVGAHSIVMENAVIRGRARHPAVIGDDVLVGCMLTSMAPGWATVVSWLLVLPCSRDASRAGSEVRIHGVVQVNTVLPPGATVPVGWVAVGDPAQIFPPA